MTYQNPNPDPYRPAMPRQQNHDAPPQRPPARTEEDLSFAMVALLALFGITSHQDRLSDSTQQAMKVVMIGGLACLVAFGFLVVFMCIAHR